MSNYTFFENYGDAQANTDTSYRTLAGGIFLGHLDGRFDEDWVSIELNDGLTYEIILDGDGPNGVVDTLLRVYNAAGELVAENEDVDFAAGNLSSALSFTPNNSGVFYLSASSYTGNTSEENGGQYIIVISNPLYFEGSDGEDVMTGTDGDDTLEGSPGADSIRGGAGFDGISYVYSKQGVEIRLHDGTARGGDAEGDTFPGRQTIEYLDAEGVTRQASVVDIEAIRGSSYDDILVGNEGENYLLGTDGDDTLNGREGDDILMGGSGSDVLIGGTGNDTVSYDAFGAANDGVEVNLSTGEAYSGDAQGDTFPGMQMVEYYDADGNLQQVMAPDIENLIGTQSGDDLTGTDGPNRLEGMRGSDILNGLAGDDVLMGGGGLDYLYGGLGDDRLEGGEDLDYLYGEQGMDYLYGGDWFDYLYGGQGDDVLIGGGGRDQLYGGPGDDRLEGGEGDDSLYGEQGDDRLEGGEGNDWLYGEQGNDQLEGGPGLDELSGERGDDLLHGGEGDDSIGGGSGNDELHGGAGDDLIGGGSGNDELHGGAGDDGLRGGPGADILRGGAGIDEAFYFDSWVGIEASLHDATLRGGDAEGDVFAGLQTIEYADEHGAIHQAVVPDIENLTGSNADDILIGDLRANQLRGWDGNDVLEGRGGDDYLIGDHGSFEPGDDKLDGGAGDDKLQGDYGADELRGGPGEDTAYYTYTREAVEIRLHDGTARGGEAEGDTFVGVKTVKYTDIEGKVQEVTVPDIENLRGSFWNDILAGAHGPNRLDGFRGDDRLYGMEGDDWLIGGDGHDILEGGPGADKLQGGPNVRRRDGEQAEDTASYASSDAGVTVRLHSVLEKGGKGGDAEGDIFFSQTYTRTGADGAVYEFEAPEVAHLIGSEHNDVLAGDFRINSIYGRGGNDLLYGGPEGGSDYISGGDGDDEVHGGKGHDRLFGDNGNDKVYGGVDNDVVLGGPGDDLLVGGPGNDRLDVKTETIDLDPAIDIVPQVKIQRFDYGNDRLEGGKGDDSFYVYPDGGDDTILDFGNGEDTIVLRAFEGIQSVADLSLRQQGEDLIIDLSEHGGDTVTLLDYNQADLTDVHFVFFMDDSASIA